MAQCQETFAAYQGRSNMLTAKVVHLYVPLFLALTMLVGSWYGVYSFLANNWDYGLFSNLIWNFSEGNGWMVSIYTGQVRVNFLADHMALIVPLLAPIFYLFPSPYTLSVLHVLACSAVLFLIPFVVREVWQQAKRQDYLVPALFILLALYFFKGFSGAWKYQTHMTTLVTPFILCAIIALHRKALVWACVWCVLVALAQERAVVSVFCIGMYAFFITTTF